MQGLKGTAGRGARNCELGGKRTVGDSEGCQRIRGPRTEEKGKI